MSGSFPELRASDDERDVVVAALRRHALAGRLDTDELEERIAAALRARTRGDLTALTADLPPDPRPARRPTAPTPAGPPPRVGGLGLQPFHHQVLLDGSRRVAFAEAMAHIVPGLFRAGYDLVARDEPAMLAFEMRDRPAWVPLVCVFAFPFGLIALAVKRSHRLVLTFDERDDGTLMTVQGEARRGVRKAFAELYSAR